MERIETEKYVITLDGDTIKCFYRHEQQITETTFKDGKTTVVTRPISQVMPGMELYPMFTAWWRPKDKAFDLDLDCGAQRWHGHQPWQEVVHALVKCGLTVKQAKLMVREAKKQE